MSQTWGCRTTGGPIAERREALLVLLRSRAHAQAHWIAQARRVAQLTGRRQRRRRLGCDPT